MFSFYGGQAGQNFDIKTIFRTVYYNNSKINGIDTIETSLQGDLNKRWNSPIGVGEFVCVSYGMPNDDFYEEYKQIDLNYTGKTYNSTFWEKIYIEKDSNEAIYQNDIFIENANYGLAYRLIASMTGNTPILHFYHEVLKSNEEPYVSYDNNRDVDYPEITLHLPRSQTLDNEIITNIINPADTAKIVLNDDENEIVDGTNLTRKDKPQLNFYLPDSAEFHFGDLLGKSVAKTYTIEEDFGYQVGDYYINKTTGFIYEITSIDTGASTEFTYRACLAGKEPKVNTATIDPYKQGVNGYTRTEVSVSTSFEDPAEQTGPIHTFTFPTLPKISTSYESVGSGDAAAVESKIIATDEINFHFTLPNGTKWFFGDEVNDNKLDAVIEGAKNGDLYLYTTNNIKDAFRGNIYKFDGETWGYTNCNIEGPVGDSLNIVAAYEIIGPAADNTLEKVTALLENPTGDYYKKQPSNSELIAINYINEEDSAQSSYWYYCLNSINSSGGTWGRALLTGGVASLIITDYSDEDLDNKAYSVSYINNLIQNEDNIEDSEKNRKTYSITLIDKKINDIKNLIEGNLAWENFIDLIE